MSPQIIFTRSDMKCVADRWAEIVEIVWRVVLVRFKGRVKWERCSRRISWVDSQGSYNISLIREGECVIKINLCVKSFEYVCGVTIKFEKFSNSINS